MPCSMIIHQCQAEHWWWNLALLKPLSNELWSRLFHCKFSHLFLLSCYNVCHPMFLSLPPNIHLFLFLISLILSINFLGVTENCFSGHRRWMEIWILTIFTIPEQEMHLFFSSLRSIPLYFSDWLIHLDILGMASCKIWTFPLLKWIIPVIYREAKRWMGPIVPTQTPVVENSTIPSHCGCKCSMQKQELEGGSSQIDIDWEISATYTGSIIWREFHKINFGL